MGLEVTTTIAGLVSANPAGSDFVLDGDDHLRLIKSVLKTTFPGAGAAGFNIPITATEAELNFVAGVTSGIQAQIDAIVGASGVFPSGTILPFFQAAPPVGWTQVVTHANAMMRVVSGSGGGSGGSDSPISKDFAHVHATSSHVLTVAETPAHDHLIAVDGFGSGVITSSNNLSQAYQYGGNDQDYTLQGVSGTPNVGKSGSVGGGSGHTHGDTISAGITYTPMYVDMIIASLD